MLNIKVKLSSEGRSNFHNVPPMFIRVEMMKYYCGYVVLTHSQIKRIHRHFCGIKGCTCGSGPDGFEQTGPKTGIIRFGQN